MAATPTTESTESTSRRQSIDLTGTQFVQLLTGDEPDVDLAAPFRIGVAGTQSVEIDGRVALAPMAGVSVQAFRRQGRRFGANVVFTEMVS
ncbi:MAG: tRNA-dihydrouridine synthase, partial [Thermoleophilia bacterium]|nr:tRNA-dihydrouridine synthase [Thermoleophilia bacterium]